MRARIADSHSTHAGCQSGTKAVSYSSRPPGFALCSYLAVGTVRCLARRSTPGEISVSDGPSRHVHKRIHIGRSRCILGDNQSAMISFKWRREAHACLWMHRNSSLNSIFFCNLLSVDCAQCRHSSTLASHVQVVKGQVARMLTRLVAATLYKN